MNIERAIKETQELYNKNNELSRGSTAIRTKTSQIETDLMNVMENSRISAGVHMESHVIFKSMCEDRIHTLIQNLSFTDSRDEVAQEVQDMGISIQEDNCALVAGMDAPPYARPERDLSQMSDANRYHYTILNAIEYLYRLILGMQGSIDIASSEPLFSAYNYLNDESKFQSLRDYKNILQSNDCSQPTKNLLGLMDQVLVSMQNNKTRLSTAITSLKQCQVENGIASQKFRDITTGLTSDNSTLFKKITFGSTSDTASEQNSFVCGDCNSITYNDEQILSVDSKVFTTKILGTNLNDIRGSVHLSVPRCSHCGRYNLVPGYFISELVKVLEDKNSLITAKAKSVIESRMTTLGKGLWDTVYESLEAAATSEEIEIIKNAMEEDLKDLPTLSVAKYKPITSFTEFKESKSDDIIQDLIQEMDEFREASMIDYSGLGKVFDDDCNCDAVSEGDKETFVLGSPNENGETQRATGVPRRYSSLKDNSGKLECKKGQADTAPDMNDSEVTSRFENNSSVTKQGTAECEETLQKLYKNRLIYKNTANTEVKLDVSPFALGLARLLLGSSTIYGYTEKDLLQSVCSPSKGYYPKLEELRDLVCFNRAVRTRIMLLNNLGCLFEDGNYVARVASLKSNSKSLEKLSINIEEFLPQGTKLPQGVEEGLNLEPVEKPYIIEEIASMMDLLTKEINEMQVDAVFSNGVSESLEDYKNILKNTEYGYPKVGMTAKTIVSKVMYEHILQESKTKIEALEDSILEYIITDSYNANSKIRLDPDSLRVNSPLFVLSETLKSRICEEVYFRELKNTVKSIDLGGYFNIPLKLSTKKPLAPLSKEISRIAELIKGERVPPAVGSLFATKVMNLLEFYNTFTSGSATDWVDLGNIYSMKGFNAKLPEVLEDYKKFNQFLGDFLFEVANIVTDSRLFRDIFTLQEELLNLSASRDEDRNAAKGEQGKHKTERNCNFRGNQKNIDGLACILSVLESNQEIEDDSTVDDYLEYFLNNELFETSDLVSQDEIYSDIWNSNNTDIDNSQKKVELLSILLIFYRDYIDEETAESISEEISQIEQEQ